MSSRPAASLRFRFGAWLLALWLIHLFWCGEKENGHRFILVKPECHSNPEVSFVSIFKFTICFMFWQGKFAMFLLLLQWKLALSTLIFSIDRPWKAEFHCKNSSLQLPWCQVASDLCQTCDRQFKPQYSKTWTKQHHRSIWLLDNMCAFQLTYYSFCVLVMIFWLSEVVVVVVVGLESSNMYLRVGWLRILQPSFPNMQDKR